MTTRGDQSPEGDCPAPQAPQAFRESLNSRRDREYTNRDNLLRLGGKIASCREGCTKWLNDAVDDLRITVDNLGLETKLTRCANC